MSSKRESDDLKQKQKKAKTQSSITEIAHSYKGFKPTENSYIDTIKLDTITPEEFFDKFVLRRKPVKIIGCIPEVNIEKYQPSNLLNFLKYDSELQVENKVQGGFGSGSQRSKMKLKELLEKLESNDSNWYLTTQYVEDEPEEEELDEMFSLAEKELNGSDSNEGNDFIPEKGAQNSEDNIEEQALLDDPENYPDISDSESFDIEDFHDDFDEEEIDDFQEDNESDDEDDAISNPVVAEISDSSLRLDEAKRRACELVQRPLTNLIAEKSISIQPELLKALIPQQINLWMGSAPKSDNAEIKLDEAAPDLGLGRTIPGGGLSSGLHHDHADNLYIPVKGKKRFALYSPFDADKMSTVGEINNIFQTGIIDYQPNDQAPEWRHIRDDGAIVTEVARWKLYKNQEIDEKLGEELLDLIETEEENLMELEDQRRNLVLNGHNAKIDPPSFSKIPPLLAHIEDVEDKTTREKISAYAEEKYPGFLKANKITAELKAGEMLFLPAGWFHEVTSYGSSDKDSIHSSLNYWFLPPNNQSIENPYKDDYWPEDFERTKKSIELVNNSVIKLD